MTFVKSLLIALALVAAAQAWIRFAPLPRARIEAYPGPWEVGIHPMKGGLKVVRPLDDLPQDAVEKLAAIAAATPRTRAIGDDPRAFVTRSRLWGFPDIALIWSDGTHLHVHSHLVFGVGDMGVNAARVARWFERLEAQG